MANTLHIYGGDVHAGQQDGDLITNARRIALEGLRGSSVSGMYAFRAVSTTYPACAVKTYFDGNDASYYKLSLDGVNWLSVLEIPYVKDENVLFFIKAIIPEDAEYGLHDSTYLVNDYLGGV